VIAALLFITLLSSGQDAPLIGTWRGTSTCVDKVKVPACKDEVVVYDAKAHPTAKDSVVISADKVVNGVREPMGDTTFGRDASGAWVSITKTPRYQVQIVLRIRGTGMSGELLDMPAGTRVRRLELTRAQ
jgi:hypothetical protein